MRRRTRYSEQGEVEITFLARFTVDHRSLLSEGESSLRRLSICLIFWRVSLWCSLPQNSTPVCIFCLVKARDTAGLDRRWHCLDTSKVTAAWPLFIAYFCSYSPKWKRGPSGVSVFEEAWGRGRRPRGFQKQPSYCNPMRNKCCWWRGFTPKETGRQRVSPPPRPWDTDVEFIYL